MEYVWIPAPAVIRLNFSKFQPTTFHHEMKTLLIYFMISKILRHLFVIERARFWRLMAALSLLTAQEWNRCLLFHVVLGFTRLSVLDQKCVNEKSKISRQMLIPVLQYCDLEDGQCKFGENFLNRHHPHIFISSYFDKRRCLFKKSECLFRLRRGRRLPWGEVLHLRQPHVPVLEIIVSGQSNTLLMAPHTRGKCQPHVSVLENIVSSRRNTLRKAPHTWGKCQPASAGDYCLWQRITLPTHL